MAQRILAAAVLTLAACGGISQMSSTAAQGGDEIVDAGTGGWKATGGSKNQGGYRNTGGSPAGGWTAAGGWTNPGGWANTGGATSWCATNLCGIGQVCCNCAWGEQCSASACSVTCQGVDDWVMPMCSRYPQADTITGCMLRQVGDDAGPFSDVDRTVQGTVRSVMYYVPTGGCLASLLPAGEGSAQAGRPIAMVVADGAGTAWDVEYDMPSGVSPLYVGDSVTVRYQYKFGGWSPSVRRLVVFRAGTVMVYVVQGGGPADAQDAPVKLSSGTAECTTTETCGTWQTQQLVASTSNGANAVLPAGGSAFLWPYYIASGGIYATTHYSPTCADWSVASFSVGITNGPLGAE